MCVILDVHEGGGVAQNYRCVWTQMGECACECAMKFWCGIITAKTNPDPDSPSGSRVRNGIGTQATRSKLEYDLATKISILLLTQPVTCEMGSPIFQPWINSKWIIPLVPPYPSPHPLIGQTEKFFSFSNIRPFHACIY